MKKLWIVGIFIIIMSSLLIGCSDNANDGNNNDNNNEEEVNEEEPNENNEEENQEEDNANNVGQNQDDANDLDENEEETLAGDVKILDVETVLDDQDEVSDFKANEDPVIEYDEVLYVEHDFITEILDYELTYDEENTFAEIFEDKGDFAYEPSHEDEDSTLMDLGQIYVEDLDEYENISEDEEELYQFIEYEGQLYVSERFTNVYMKSPLNYERRDETLEIGLKSESETLYDIGITDDSSSAEATQNASDVTVEGKNYDGGIVLKNVNSSTKHANIDIDYNYSKIEGFIHNKPDGDDTIEIKFQYDDDKTLDSVELEPGETHEFDFDVKGEYVFKVLAKGAPGTSSDAVMIGELK